MVKTKTEELKELFTNLLVAENHHQVMLKDLAKGIDHEAGFGSWENVTNAKNELVTFMEENVIK